MYIYTALSFKSFLKESPKQSLHLSFVCSLKHGDIWILWATEGILLLGDNLEFWISRHNDDDEGVWHK